MTLPTPLKGHFIFGRLVLAAVNLPTKFQLSRFRHSRERSGSRILKSASAYPDHVPWRGTLSFVGLYLPRGTYVPNLKCLSSFIPEIGWLPIFLNSGSWPVCFTSASNYLPYVSIEEYNIGCCFFSVRRRWHRSAWNFAWWHMAVPDRDLLPFLWRYPQGSLNPKCWT